VSRNGEVDRARRGIVGRWPSAVLAAALLVAGGALLMVGLRGPDAPRTLDERVDAVASTIRCPVCQNLSVADSPSRLAAGMRAEIARDLRAGKSPSEIRAELAAAYGEWILQAPPKEGIGLVAWLAPALLLLGGAVAAVAAVRGWTARGGRSRRPGAAPALSPEDRALLRRAMAEEEGP
jgi:cytochrome c-type biogenesis protein CcmH